LAWTALLRFLGAADLPAGVRLEVLREVFATAFLAGFLGVAILLYVYQKYPLSASRIIRLGALLAQAFLPAF
jgi:hypothetical protein